MNGLMGDWEANDLRWWSDKDVVYKQGWPRHPRARGQVERQK